MSAIEKEILTALISTTGIILVLVASFIFFLNKNQKRMREKQLELFNSVLHAQEKEQERIAQDLHDQLGPLLSIIKSQILSVDNKGLDEMDRGILQEASVQLGNAVTDVRSIAHNLIPKTFTEYGFLKSIEYYIIRIREFNNIDVHFKHSSWLENISKSFEISLFRILQELFLNTIKHANASRIDLDLQVTDNELTILFSDNGRGLNPDHFNHKGIGLRNIETRVKYLGGKHDVKSKPNEGCMFHFTFNRATLYGR